MLAFLLFASLSHLTLSSICQQIQIPSFFYASERAIPTSYPIDQYIINDYPHLNKYLKGPIFVKQQYNNITFKNSVPGTPYPLHISYDVQGVKLRIEWKNLTNSKVEKVYELELNFTSTCQVIMHDFDFAIYQMNPHYNLLAVCENSTNYMSYHIERHRSDFFEIYYGDVESKLSGYAYGQLLQRYNYNDYLYNKDAYRLVKNESSSFLQVFQIDGSVRKEDFTYMKNKYNISHFVVSDYLYSFTYSFYVENSYGLLIISSDGSVYSWKPHEKILRISKVCWSNMIIVRTQIAVYFLQIQSKNGLNVIQLGTYKNAIKNKFKWVGIGKYGVEVSGQNWTMYYFSLKDNKVKVIRMENSELNLDYFRTDEDLCSTNSFYYNDTKYSISEVQIQFYKTENVTLEWDTCNITITHQVIKIQHFSDIPSNKILQLKDSFFIFKPEYFKGDEFSLQAQINSKKINIPTSFTSDILSFSDNLIDFAQINDQQLIIISAKKYVEFYYVTEYKNSKLIYSIEDFDVKGVESMISVKQIDEETIIYVHVRNSNSETMSIMIGIKNKNAQIRVSSQGNVDTFSLKQTGIIYESQENMFQTGVNWIQFSAISETNFQRQAFAHFHFTSNASVSPSQVIKYPYEFQHSGYRYCTLPQGRIIFYQHGQNYLQIMQVGVRLNSYYVIEHISFYQAYNSYQVKCMHEGIGLFGSKQIIVFDEFMKRKISLFLNEPTQQDKITSKYILHQSSSNIEFYEIQTGFLLKTIPQMNLQQVFANKHSEGIIFSDHTYFLPCRFFPFAYEKSEGNPFFVYMQAYNLAQSQSLMYIINEMNTLPLLDNSTSLVVEDSKFDDSIWNSTVDSVKISQNKVSHFKLIKQEIPKQNNRIYRYLSIEGNEVRLQIYPKSASSKSKIVLFVNGIQKDSIEAQNDSDLVGLSNQKGRQFVVAWRSKNQILFQHMQLSGLQIVKIKTYAFQKPFLMFYDFTKITFVDDYLFIHEKDEVNWNTTINNGTVGRYKSQGKIVLYNIANKTMREFAPSLYKNTNEKVNSFFVIKQQSRLYLLIISTQSIIIQGISPMKLIKIISVEKNEGGYLVSGNFQMNKEKYFIVYFCKKLLCFKIWKKKQFLLQNIDEKHTFN